MPDTSATRGVMKSGIAIAALGFMLLATNYAQSFVLKNSLSWILGFINALQIVFHLPLIQVNFPANVTGFFRLTMPLV